MRDGPTPYVGSTTVAEMVARSGDRSMVTGSMRAVRETGQERGVVPMRAKGM